MDIMYIGRGNYGLLLRKARLLATEMRSRLEPSPVVLELLRMQSGPNQHSGPG
jgi:hypothetical protein